MEFEISKYLRVNPHKMLTRLIAANIVLDIIAVTFWTAFPATQWSIYRLGFSIVGTEAALAAALFALTLIGLIKRKKWAPFLAIVITAHNGRLALTRSFQILAIFWLNH
jgi:hypothetical protein